MNCFAKLNTVLLIAVFLATSAFAGLDWVINPESGNLDTIGQSSTDITENDARYLKLDCSNDPLTAALQVDAGIIDTRTSGAGGVVVGVNNTSTSGLNYNPTTGIMSFVSGPTTTWSVNLGSGDTGISNSTATTTIYSNTSFSDKNITNVGAIDLDLIRADAVNGSVTIELDNAAGADLLVGNNNVLVVEGDNDRVGIGTNAPDSIFHIKANTPGTVGSHPAGQLIIQSPIDSVITGNAVITGYESDGAGNPDQQLWYLGSSSSSTSDILFLNRRNSKLHLGTNGATRLTILGNGKVGIGTAAPARLLDVGGFGAATFGTPLVSVKDDVNDTSGLYMRNSSAGTSADFRFIVWNNAQNQYVAFATPSDNNNVGNLFGIARSAGNFIFNNTTAGGTARELAIGTFANKDFRLGTNNTMRIMIEDSGNVGINTVTPAYKLDVAAVDNVALFQGTSAAFVRIAIDAIANSDAQVAFREAGSTKWSIGNDGSDSDKFKFMPVGGGGVFDGTEVLTIQADGNIGINTTSPDTKFQVVGVSRFGEDTTNYSEFELDGTLEFNGTATVFDDLRTPVNAVRVPGSKAPTWTAYNGTQLLGFGYQAVEGNEEEIYFTIQLTHAYKEGSDIVPHVHWVPNEDTTDDPEVVRWGLEYEWQNIDGTFAGSTTIHAEESMTDRANDHIKTLFPAIDGTGKTISSMLTCRLFRNSSSVNDTYDSGTALALFMEIDFHFEKDTVGSRLINDSK